MGRKAFLNITCVTAAFVSAWAITEAPWRMVSEQETRTSEQLQQMRKSEAGRQNLLRSQARYSSSVGREELARTRKWVRPNERPIQIPE